MSNRICDRPIIVALDFSDTGEALALTEQLDPQRCRVKVGKELFGRGGPDVVRRLVDDGFDVFLDLKFHDIPNTVAGACKAALDMGVWMLNVHALGGRVMMETARDAIGTGPDSPLLIAVTMLTSLNERDLMEIGLRGEPSDHVGRLAKLAESCAIDGVVCSAQEINLIRAVCVPEFRLVTPGIRPAGSDYGDQRRVMTPGEALKAGSDYLVVGRPITAASDPLAALRAIEEEVGAASVTTTI